MPLDQHGKISSSFQTDTYPGPKWNWACIQLDTIQTDSIQEGDLYTWEGLLVLWGGSMWGIKLWRFKANTSKTLTFTHSRYSAYVLFLWCILHESIGNTLTKRGNLQLQETGYFSQESFCYWGSLNSENYKVLHLTTVWLTSNLILCDGVMQSCHILNSY